jgi:transaldolase
MYVNELIAPLTVNTMPEATLEAAAASQNFRGDSIRENYGESEEILANLNQIGIDIEKVATKLEEEGIDKFIKPWLSLISVVEKVTH